MKSYIKQRGQRCKIIYAHGYETCIIQVQRAKGLIGRRGHLKSKSPSRETTRLLHYLRRVRQLHAPEVPRVCKYLINICGMSKYTFRLRIQYFNCIPKVSGIKEFELLK